jgi:multicomponent Na+:H+ antiporter subunit G
MNLVAVVLIVGGLFFFTGGSIGILRFPDFYSRLHPAGKLDTAGQLLTLSGTAIILIGDFAREDLLTAAKIMLIVIFVYLTSPTATHAIVDAGVRAGLKPWKKDAAETSTTTEAAR